MKEKPMRFHKLLLYFSFPIGMIGNIATLINLIRTYENKHMLMYQLLRFDWRLTSSEALEIAEKICTIQMTQGIVLGISILLQILVIKCLAQRDSLIFFGLTWLFANELFFEFYLLLKYSNPFAHIDLVLPYNYEVQLGRVIAVSMYYMLIIVYYFKRRRYFKTTISENK